jgi:hypothetical protein
LIFCGSAFGVCGIKKSSTVCNSGRLASEKQRLSEERDNPSEKPLSEIDCIGLPYKLCTFNVELHKTHKKM